MLTALAIFRKLRKTTSLNFSFPKSEKWDFSPIWIKRGDACKVPSTWMC